MPMAHIRNVNETHATGSVAEDYAFQSASYSKMLGPGTPTPQVYRTNSILPEYFRFGAMQNRVLTNDGSHDDAGGPVPSILVMFAISFYAYVVA
jgi:hypothetical protein